LTDFAAEKMIDPPAEDPVTTTLLAVDDSKTMRKVLEITFAGEDYKTVLAGSGGEAMQQLASAKPALVLVDHTLGDGTGYELCQKIKGAAPGTRVIILSSKQSPYDRARGTAAGADDFMDKPFDTQKLLDKVTAVMTQPAAKPAAAAPAAAAHAPAAAPNPMPRPMVSPARSPGLGAGPVGSMAARPRPATAAPAPAAVAATPRPADASPRPNPAIQARPAMPVGGRPAPAPQKPIPASAPVAVPAAAPVAAAIAASNGQLADKLGGLGLSPDQVQAVLSLSRDVVERVVWEVVPVLAEALIKEEIQRLTSE
jgi:CheY-like chemotaxis protein